MNKLLILFGAMVIGGYSTSGETWGPKGSSFWSRMKQKPENDVEPLIRKLNSDAPTKRNTFLNLSRIAKNAEARDTLIELGVIDSVDRLVDKLEYEGEYDENVYYYTTLLIERILSIEGLDCEAAHSLVPVLKKSLRLRKVKMSAATARIVEAVDHLMTKQNCVAGLDEELITQLMELTSQPSLNKEVTTVDRSAL